MLLNRNTDLCPPPPCSWHRCGVSSTTWMTWMTRSLRRADASDPCRPTSPSSPRLCCKSPHETTPPLPLPKAEESTTLLINRLTAQPDTHIYTHTPRDTHRHTRASVRHTFMHLRINGDSLHAYTGSVHTSFVHMHTHVISIHAHKTSVHTHIFLFTLTRTPK